MSCLILTNPKEPTSSIVRDVGRRNGTLLAEGGEGGTIDCGRERVLYERDGGPIVGSDPRMEQRCGFRGEVRPKRSRAPEKRAGS